MIRAARTYAWILLIACTLMSLALLHRDISALSFLFYAALLVVILLALHGKGGNALGQAALTLSGLWLGASVVCGALLLVRLNGWYAIATALALVILGIIPGALCCLAVARLRKASQTGR